MPALLSRLIRNVTNTLKPYETRVVWGLGAFKHRAWTREDALAWAAQYPADAEVSIVKRRGAIIGSRSPRATTLSASLALAGRRAPTMVAPALK